MGSLILKSQETEALGQRLGILKSTFGGTSGKWLGQVSSHVL